MKFLLFLIIFPTLIFAQIDCDKSKKLSYEYWKGNNKTKLKILKEIKNDNNEKYINFNIAEIYFQENKYNKAKKIFLKIYHSDFENYYSNDTCDNFFDIDNVGYENLIYHNSYSSETKRESLFYLFLINLNKRKYEKALKQFNEYYSKSKKGKFTCMNSFYIHFRKHEYNRMKLLDKMNKFREINKSSLSMLLLTENQEYLKLLISNLKKEYNVSEINAELKSGLSKITKGKVVLLGIETTMKYIPFFEKKIIIWNDKEDSDELIKSIKNSIGYKMLMKK